MAFKLNHVHLKTDDPKATAEFYVQNLGATMVAEIAEGPDGVQFEILEMQS